MFKTVGHPHPSRKPDRALPANRYHAAMLTDVFITRAGLHAAADRLRTAGLHIEINSTDRIPTDSEFHIAARGCRALVCTVADKVNDALFDAAGPNLRIVATSAAGYENFDVAAARRRNIMLTNAGRALTDTVADLTFALMLAAARRLGESERCLRTGKWPGWAFDQFLGLDVHGKTLGIVGFGRIGRAVARRAAGFNMRVLYTNRSTIPPSESAGATRADLDTLLTESDFVALLVPKTPETRHLIGEAQLHRMKPTAILINAARGDVVDEAALVRALQKKQIAAAGLDVYEREPIVSPGLLELENVVLLPHIGSATAATRERMALMAAENVLAVLENRPPLDPIPELATK